MGKILRFPAEPPVDRQQTLAAASRSYLAVEEALAGHWSDSTLVACLANASRVERMHIIAELEARANAKRRSPL